MRKKELPRSGPTRLHRFCGEKVVLKSKYQLQHQLVGKKRQQVCKEKTRKKKFSRVFTRNRHGPLCSRLPLSKDLMGNKKFFK